MQFSLLYFSISFILANYLGNFFLPWWGSALMASICAFAFPAKAWLQNILGGIILCAFWFLHLNTINSINNGILLSKLNIIFEKLPLSLWGLSLIIAFILGFLGTALGVYTREAFFAQSTRKRKRRW